MGHRTYLVGTSQLSIGHRTNDMPSPIGQMSQQEIVKSFVHFPPDADSSLNHAPLAAHLLTPLRDVGSVRDLILW